MVEVALAEREAGVAAAAGEREVLGERAGGGEVDGIGPRHHHLPRDPLGELEDVRQQIALRGGEERSLARPEQEAHLLLAVGLLGFRGRLQSGEPQQRVGRMVEEPDRRVGEAVEAGERQRDPDRDPLGAPDRERFRDQLAEDDVEHADREESGGEARRVDDGGRHSGQMGEQRGEHPDERRFADPAEREAREGDPELGGGEVGVEMGDHVRRDPAPPLAAEDVRLDLGRPDLGQGELGSDEEAVERHEQQRDRQRGAGAETEGGKGRRGGDEREERHAKKHAP